MSEPYPAGHVASPHAEQMQHDAVLNLSTIAEQALQQYGHLIRQGRLIARCESLPVVAGNATDYQKLFELILSLVIQHESGKQYLHIDCCEAFAEADEGESVNADMKRYCIEFRSNIKPVISTEGPQGEVLEACYEILAMYDATLQVICADKEGCMLRLLLNGKMF